MGTNAEPQLVKIDAQLETSKVLEVEQLLKEFKDVFAWTYKYLKGIPPKLAQHKIELDTTIPLAHQARYKSKPNYVRIVKQDIDKLLAIRFIQFVEKATWSSPIVYCKLKICIDSKKQNATTKKDPYPLPFIDEMLNTLVGYEAYSFLDGYLGYHKFFIALKDKYKITFIIDSGGFIWKVMPFQAKNGPPTYQRVVTKAFR